MEKGKRRIDFRYKEEDGSISLGVPEDIGAELGNDIDGGCNLKFSTSEFSIGLKEKFSLYLFAEDVNEVSRKIWGAYLATEPDRAKQDFKRFVKDIKRLE